MITIGSRGSALALWQAQHIAAALESLGETTRIEIVKTTGDRITDVPLAKIGGKGLFTKELEEALLAKRIDLAVHSMKDMPADVPEGLRIAAIPRREDARDAMVGRRLDELAAGAKVGTSSLRRSAQLLALRPELQIEMLRGNVDTRLRKLDEGQFDAIVLAAAGLRRLGLEWRISEGLAVDVMCPAPGQGALAIETRDEGLISQFAQRLDHPETRRAVETERSLLAVLGGGCQVPIGAHATIRDRTIHLRAVVASPDGTRLIQGEASGESVSIGAELGEKLLAQGAREILDEIYQA